MCWVRASNEEPLDRNESGYAFNFYGCGTLASSREVGRSGGKSA